MMAAWWMRSSMAFTRSGVGEALEVGDALARQGVPAIGDQQRLQRPALRLRALAAAVEGAVLDPRALRGQQLPAAVRVLALRERAVQRVELAVGLLGALVG